MKIALLAALLSAPSEAALVNVITSPAPAAAPAASRAGVLAALRELNDELLRSLFLGPAPAARPHAPSSAPRTRSVSSVRANGL